MHCVSSNVSVTLANAPKLWKRGTQRHYGQECPVNGEWERTANSFLYRELVTWGKAFISSADVCLGFPVEQNPCLSFWAISSGALGSILRRPYNY